MNCARTGAGRASKFIAPVASAALGVVFNLRQPAWTQATGLACCLLSVVCCLLAKSVAPSRPAGLQLSGDTCFKLASPNSDGADFVITSAAAGRQIESNARLFNEPTGVNAPRPARPIRRGPRPRFSSPACDVVAKLAYVSSASLPAASPSPRALISLAARRCCLIN